MIRCIWTAVLGMGWLGQREPWKGWLGIGVLDGLDAPETLEGAGGTPKIDLPGVGGRLRGEG